MASWQTWVKGLLEKTAKRWPVWFGLTAVAGAAAFLLLPEVRALDLRIGFGPNEGNDVLTALGEEGRRDYAVYLVADVVFLLLYTWFGVNATFAVFEGSRWVRLVAVPAATGAFDLVEDVFVALALAAYPSPAEGSLVVASAAGALKFLGIVLSALLVLVGLLIKASGTNGRRDKNIEQTYFALRLGAALFLVLLIVGVAHQVIVTPGQSFLGSVSAYYYTPAQAVFVAGLCAVGACLVIYRGNNDTENVVLDFTGFMAFVVAFVPTPAQGGCLDANVVTQEPVAALIRNSITALFIVCGVAVVVAAFSKQVRAGAPLTKFAKRAIGVSAAALLVGLGWFAGARPSFEGCGHAVAAATLFVGIVAVVVLNAAGYARMDRADSRMKHNWYLGVALVMVASLITLVAASQFGYQHWFFTLEAALILEFAVFWLLQSYELRGDVRRPPPQPTTAGDDASEDTSEGEPEPSAGTFQTAEPGRA